MNTKAEIRGLVCSRCGGVPGEHGEYKGEPTYTMEPSNPRDMPQVFRCGVWVDSKDAQDT